LFFFPLGFFAFVLEAVALESVAASSSDSPSATATASFSDWRWAAASTCFEMFFFLAGVVARPVRFLLVVVELDMGAGGGVRTNVHWYNSTMVQCYNSVIPHGTIAHARIAE